MSMRQRAALRSSDTVIRTAALALLFLLETSRLSLGQGGFDDYQRARSLRDATSNRVFGTSVNPKWLSNDQQFWYRVNRGQDAYEFMFVDATTGERRTAFDHQRLASQLSLVTDQPVDPDKLPFTTISLSDQELSFSVDGQSFKCDLMSYEILKIEPDPARDETTVEVLDQPRRSRGGGGDTSIQFINRRATPIELFFVDRSGDTKSYGMVDANSLRDQHTFDGHVWLIKSAGGEALMCVRANRNPGVAVVTSTSRLLNSEVRQRDRRRRSGESESPDGRWIARIKDFNIWVQSQDDDTSFALTHDGTIENAYERLNWSPNSEKLQAVQEEKGQTRIVSFVESAPEDHLQPTLHQFEYRKPGDRIPHARPRLFDIPSRSNIPIDEAIIPNPWALQNFRWKSDSSRFTFTYNQRGHQVLRVVAVDAQTGTARTLVNEASKTFVDYAYKQYSQFLDETNELIWMSERDGWNHLYLYDSESGSLKNQITQGEWVVRSVERIDEDTRQIWFVASGVYPDQDPYYRHFCRVGFDGKNFQILTAGNGTHEVTFSPDQSYFLDRWSRVDFAPVTELRSSQDGELICAVERADASELDEIGWQRPVRFDAAGRDGETRIYGNLYFPRNHDPNQSYPVIEKIYAGPHGSFVPKRFSSYYNEQAIAELGFIVVQIDGMGTSNRSKAFHDVCWKNLADSGFPDRIKWMRAAAEKYGSMDLDRVGIYGGSAGGQSALRALLAHPDFYKVAVADCGCHDNRMDKIWWNELWMGWPIDQHYEAQSNVTQAHRLQGKLLLTVGEVDRNVDPASTMQVVKALIDANKDFDLIVFPGRGHGVGESDYGRRRRRDFFVRHLLNVEPRWKRED